MSSRLFPTICLFVLALLLQSCASGPKTGQRPRTAKGKDNGLYHYIVSQLDSLEGKEGESLFSLERSLKKNPGSTFLQIKKAYQLARTNRFDEAEKIGLKILKTYPNDPLVHLLLGKVYNTKGHMKEALHHYDQAIRLDPEGREPYHLVARYYMTIGEHAKAAATLTRLIQANPDDVSAHYLLASLYAGYLKDYGKALKAYEDILEINPDDQRILGLMSEIYLLQKNYPKALETFLKLQELTPQDLTLQTRIALLYYESGNLDRAVETFQSALGTYPHSDRIVYYLGILHQEKKDVEKALYYLGQVQATSTFYEDVITRQAILLKNEKRMNEGITLLRKAIGQKRKNVNFHDMLGSLYAINGNYDKAVEALKVGLREIPNSEPLLFSLGVIHERQGKWKESIQAMRQVVEVNDQNAMALNFIGYMYAERGENLDESQTLIERALKLKPKDGLITDSLGWVYYQKNQIPKAIEVLEQANRLAPNEATILEHLGDAYLKAGNRARAKTLYGQALAQLKKVKDPDEKKKEQVVGIEKKLKEL